MRDSQDGRQRSDDRSATPPAVDAPNIDPLGVGVIVSVSANAALAASRTRHHATPGARHETTGNAKRVSRAPRSVSAVDEVRHDLLGRWEIRLLGLGRLFQRGVTAVHEGRVLRVQVHADDSEVRRVTTIVNILRAVSL